MEAATQPGSRKRGAEEAAHDDVSNKIAKGKKQWRTPHQLRADSGPVAYAIEPGDSGIWATCNLGKEGKCVTELRDCFDEFAAKLYEARCESDPPEQTDADGNGGGVDIETEISNEIRDIRKPPPNSGLFTHVKLDTDCVIFFKTASPIEPVRFVHEICKDAASNPEKRRGRFIKRLTPMTLMGKATEKGLDEVAKAVLAPHFHAPESKGIKFAIRPNLRNHATLSRNAVIKQVASAVGPGHEVDLKNYDLLVLVEMYKNICGMSVVENDFEHLRRYNISEIYDKFSAPSPPAQ